MTGIEPTVEGIVDGARRLVGSTPRLTQVTDRADLDRWLDEHEAVYERASTSA